MFAFIALVAISCIMLLPLDPLLKGMGLSDFQTEYLGLTFKMAFIFSISLWIISKTGMANISGLSSKYKWKFKYYNLIPVYLILLGVLSAMSYDLRRIEPGDLILLLVACLTVGFAEEFLFRGLLQSKSLQAFHNRKHGVLTGLLPPAIIFGLFHLINLTKNDDTTAVLVQVVFATFIGFYFGVLVLKTNKIIPVAITHGLINFSFSIPFLPGVNMEETTGASIAPILLTLPLFIIGLLVVRKIDRSEVEEKIEASFN